MFKRIVFGALILTAGLAVRARAACVEVSVSTCVGDFANGGDMELGNRLLGNVSGYSLGFIQKNKVRILIASGTVSDVNISTANAGYVGIQTDGINQFPLYPLDVWGRFRSTDTVMLATNGTSYVSIGTMTIITNPPFLFDVRTGTGAFLDLVVGASITLRGIHYNPPPTDGSSGQFLSTNGNGGLSWATVSGGGGGAVGNSTSVISLSGGGVFLSTAGPISSSSYRISKGTMVVCGFDAFVNKASSVGATNLKVWYTTSTNYGVTWSTMSPTLVITTNTSFATYISSAFTICDGCRFAVGIDTVPTSGLLPEDWQVNIYGIISRDFQLW